MYLMFCLFQGKKTCFEFTINALPMASHSLLTLTNKAGYLASMTGCGGRLLAIINYLP